MKTCGKERGQRPVSLGSGKYSACETIQVFELLAPCYLPGQDRQKPGHFHDFSPAPLALPATTLLCETEGQIGG